MQWSVRLLTGALGFIIAAPIVPFRIATAAGAEPHSDSQKTPWGDISLIDEREFGIVRSTHSMGFLRYSEC
jgi:hypothetical protein